MISRPYPPSLDYTFCPGTGCAEVSTCRFVLTPEIQRHADDVGKPLAQAQFAESMPCYAPAQPRSRRSGDGTIEV
mgnify:CR=1 FL=1